MDDGDADAADMHCFHAVRDAGFNEWTTLDLDGSQEAIFDLALQLSGVFRQWLGECQVGQREEGSKVTKLA